MNSFALRASSVYGLLAAIALAGCASKVPLDTPATAPSTSSSSSGSDASTTASTPVAPVQATTSAPMAADVPRIIYFDFDSYLVKEEFQPVVQANAQLLTGTPTRRMAVEGHADERGSSEYNLALGQKRAEAVVKSLTLLGVRTDQIEPVSYGEERPAADGSSEEAWAKNRRVELKDR